MTLKTDLRSPDDKKFKGHTEDKTIKVASAKKFIKDAGYKARAISVDFNPSFKIINKLRDKLSNAILKKLKKK